LTPLRLRASASASFLVGKSQSSLSTAGSGCPAVEQWLQQALACPGVQLLELTPRIVVESTRLPAPFHRDPADQLIVATARVHGVRVASADSKVLEYPHVETLRMGS
jgi:PIN domain nuclease of toxin-antitoxin system